MIYSKWACLEQLRRPSWRNGYRIDFEAGGPGGDLGGVTDIYHSARRGIDHLLTGGIDHFPCMGSCPYKENNLCQLSVNDLCHSIDVLCNQETRSHQLDNFRGIYLCLM